MYVDSTLGLDSAPDSRLDDSLVASLWIATPVVTLADGALSPQMGAGGCKDHLGGTRIQPTGPRPDAVIASSTTANPLFGGLVDELNKISPTNQVD